MSDKDHKPHESWCDTQNKISEVCNCMVGGYIEEIEYLKKENDKLRDQLKKALDAIPWDSDYFEDEDE